MSILPPISSLDHTLTNNQSSYDCIVIGGGFAGANTAVLLTQHKKKILLLEARDSIGGRVSSFTDQTTGDVIDNGQHVMMGCYHHALALADTLNTRHILVPQTALRVVFRDTTQRSTLDAGRLPQWLPRSAGIALGMMCIEHFSPSERFFLLQFSLRLRLGLVRTQGYTCLEVLTAHHQSRRLIERLWEPIILATLNTSPRLASAELLYTVMRLAFFAGGTASQMLLPRHGLGDILSPLPAWLEAHGSRVQCSAMVESIEHHHPDSTAQNQQMHYQVRTTSGQIYAAQHIVCAVPPFIAKKILPPDALPKQTMTWMQTLSYSPIVSVYVWFDRDGVEEDFVALLGTTIQWVFNRRVLCETHPIQRFRYPGHLALTISAADDIVTLPQSTIVQRCVEELRSVFPALRSAELLHSRVIVERRATPLLSPDRTEARPHAHTLLPGLVLAGDYTATGLPATIEGAAYSGYIAAQAILSI